MKQLEFRLLTVWFVAVNLSLAEPLCEDLCKCENGKLSKTRTYVDCSQMHLLAIPAVDEWPPYAEELDLSCNNITVLDVEFTHEYLRVLRLNGNGINTVKASVFSGLKNLQHLDLSNNEMTEITNNAFRGLVNLLSLNLSHNKIKALNDFAFSELLLLRDLSLSNNEIVHFQNSHWNRMYQLRKLDLSNVGAYAFDANLFHGFDKLEILDISQNDFTQVPTKALRSAKSLQWLRLSENPIERLDKSSFVKLNALKVLEINFMEHLVEIGAETFSHLTSLCSLDVSSNQKLKFIDHDAFKSLFDNLTHVHLKRVSLQLNKLSSLAPLPCNRMEKINLQGNPWKCDCRMRWLKNCYIAEVYAADLKCHFPDHLRGVLIKNTPTESFSCEFQQSQIFKDVHRTAVIPAASLAFGCLFLVILALLMASLMKWRSIRSWWRNKKKGVGAVYYVRAHVNPLET